jgi:hypothetical protein
MLLQVVSAVLQSGQNLAQKEGRHVPLMYMWHGKYYLGGAHGIAGILYMLLQVKKGENVVNQSTFNVLSCNYHYVV